MSASPACASATVLVPPAGSQAHIGDRPMVESQTGDVAGPFGFRATRPQHDVSLAQAVSVGQSRPMPQAGVEVGPHRLAALGDGDRSPREEHGPIDESLSERHHRQGLQSLGQSLVVGQTLPVVDRSLRQRREPAPPARPEP